MNIFENHSFIDPRIPFIFHNYSLPSSYNSNQTMNWHENIELLYFRGGRATARIGGYTVKASKGDIIVVNSNLLHGVIAHSKLEFYCLIIDRSFCLSNHLDIGSMDFEAVIRDNDIAEELEKFSATFADKEQPFRHLMLRASALHILSLICSRYGYPRKQNTEEMHLLSAIKHALGYIYSESHRDLTLDDISAKSGLSKYYFAHEFKRMTGQTVISYLNGVRCEKASELLVTGSMSIEAIALECGFSSSSYFIRTFKKIYSASPGEYRRKFRN